MLDLHVAKPGLIQHRTWSSPEKFVAPNILLPLSKRSVLIQGGEAEEDQTLEKEQSSGGKLQEMSYHGECDFLFVGHLLALGLSLMSSAPVQRLF